MKCKYALQKLNCFYQQKEVFEDDSSIEHIIPECADGDVHNIGNLIVLEGSLNTKADNMDYSDKLEVYKRSNYKWIKEFAIQYPVWNKDIIKDRAKNMASLYFEKILSFKKF